MKQSEWAKREIELAFESDASEEGESECSYIRLCYESALKAFLSLCEDGHSGMSFGITKNILLRLMEGLPLTPIEGKDDDWSYAFTDDDESEVFQCTRMSKLFKYVHPDGSVEYHANNFHCVEEDTGRWYFGGGARDILEEYIGKIQMPYTPLDTEYEVHTRTYLSDPANGDFDTKEYLYIVRPDKTRVDVNRYFGETEDGWKELDRETFEARKKMHEDRERAMTHDNS